MIYFKKRQNTRMPSLSKIWPMMSERISLCTVYESKLYLHREKNCQLKIEVERKYVRHYELKKGGE